MPALAAAIYIGFYAALRNSGGRYLIPIIWTAFLYYGVGLTETANLHQINKT